MKIADIDERYFTALAAAFCRGRLKLPSSVTDTAAFEQGRSAGLRLHKFKRTMELSRVRRVLGLLHGLGPENLLDIGSGRGTFLWPLLDTFPELQVTAIDAQLQRANDLAAVATGGIHRLQAFYMDAETLSFPDKAYDVVTMLEVLEHLSAPHQAVTEAIRVGRRFLVVSVPSKADDNPEHIQLFTVQSLRKLLHTAGARAVSLTSVLNHIIGVARLS